MPGLLHESIPNPLVRRWSRGNVKLAQIVFWADADADADENGCTATAVATRRASGTISSVQNRAKGTAREG